MTAAENGFTSVEIATTHGSRDMPCEIVTDGLVIVPAFGEDETGTSVLMGGFSVTHAPSGRMVTQSHACLPCARMTALNLANTGVDWASLQFTGQEETKAAVGNRMSAVTAAMAEFEQCRHVGGAR
ncbi:hypothetical protein [Paractinoplanes maris]|uniref:hypothetical protein n=1 Tax=Paractinoplanes maris TaxID=1734446 RepID=UPI00201FC49A|nr:hypothetical protein [Actinoplanes maris]